MHRTGHERTTIRDFAFLLGGVGIGSAIALLLAPTSGEDLRYQIGHGYRTTVKKLRRRTEELADRAEDFLDEARRLSNSGAKLLHMGRESLRRRA
jgi:gas vesicle protein